MEETFDNGRDTLVVVLELAVGLSDEPNLLVEVVGLDLDAPMAFFGRSVKLDLITIWRADNVLASPLPSSWCRNFLSESPGPLDVSIPFGDLHLNFVGASWAVGVLGGACKVTNKPILDRVLRHAESIG